MGAGAKGYVETYLGDVWPREVDPTEHFTVAAYYRKFEAATWRFLMLRGADPAAARTTAALTHYKAELRVRDVYRIETALVEAGARPVLGHKVFDAGSGRLCTTMRQRLAGVALDGPAAEWDGDPWEDRPAPGAGAGWTRTSATVVRPEEADWTGGLSLGGYIDRFSTANSLAMSAFGMTPEYLTRARAGLSTFEFQLAIADGAPPRPGDPLDVETCIAHLGGSSMRFVHRMRNAATGAEAATLGQFGVHLDLDARRPSRIPDDLRERALATMAAA